MHLLLKQSWTTANLTLAKTRLSALATTWPTSATVVSYRSLSLSLIKCFSSGNYVYYKILVN